MDRGPATNLLGEGQQDYNCPNSGTFRLNMGSCYTHLYMGLCFHRGFVTNRQRGSVTPSDNIRENTYPSPAKLLHL
jgi:hypothetical protein